MATHTENETFSWEEIARALFKSRGITTGLWRVGASLKFAAANTGPNTDAVMPSGVVAIEMLVLAPVTQPGPLVFDARTLSKATRPSGAPKAVTKSVKKRVGLKQQA